MLLKDPFPTETVYVGYKEDDGEDDSGPVSDSHPSLEGGVYMYEVAVAAGDGSEVGEREDDKPYPHTPEVTVSHCFFLFDVVVGKLEG